MFLMIFRYFTKILAEKNNDQFILYLHIPPYYLWCRVLGSCSRLPNFLASSVPKKFTTYNFKQLPNSHVSHRFSEVQIMPISMLFKFRVIIFIKMILFQEKTAAMFWKAYIQLKLEEVKKMKKIH